MNNYNDFSKVGSFVLLNSGADFDFLNPEASHICIEDIAHALSHICRFNGQCKRFYSVAEHSVVVSYLVPEEFEYDALMHDAAEAYLGDVQTPLKKLLPDFKTIEDRVEAAVFKAMGVNYPLHSEIKKADLKALGMEKRDIMPETSSKWTVLDGVEIPSHVNIVGVSPEVARSMFLSRFKEIKEKQQKVLTV